MNKARQLVDFISPNPIIPGRAALVLAVHYTAQYEAAGADGAYTFSKTIYPMVARDLSCSVQAAEKAVRRAVGCCWLCGRNNALEQIVGKKLPSRPTPGHFLAYCAYYINHQAPFHGPVTLC